MHCRHSYEIITLCLLDGLPFAIGDFRNNNRQGYGVLTYKDGAVYSGEFLENKKHGYGRSVYLNATHEGNYYRDKRNGHGKYICSTGDSYEGNFGE